MPNREELYDFLKKIDSEFTPSLSSKVNLEQYVEKILEKSEVLIEFQDGNIAGVLVMYCNDYINQTAYATLLGVDPIFRGRGIARKLMNDAISLANSKGMKKLSLYSNNPIAIRLYHDIGFNVVEDGERKKMEYLMR